MLGIKGSWYIKSVILSEEIKQVTVEVALRKGLVWADPTDKTARAHINGWIERQWRHLDTVIIPFCNGFRSRNLCSVG